MLPLNMLIFLRRGLALVVLALERAVGKWRNIGVIYLVLFWE